MPCRGRLLLLLLLALAPAPAAAQEDYVAQVWDQLRAVEIHRNDMDLHHALIATLERGDTYGFTTDLDAGAEYLVYAGCDLDCSDVDLWIRDEAGNALASDTAADDTPALVFSPTRTAKYRIEVKMVTCVEEYCYFGFGILESSY